jgi:ERCC4-type nuclease
MSTNTQKDLQSDLPKGLASPARRALAGAGITSLNHFTQITEAELMKLHGMGPKARDIIRQELAANGLSFSSGS